MVFITGPPGHHANFRRSVTMEKCDPSYMEAVQDSTKAENV